MDQNERERKSGSQLAERSEVGKKRSWTLKDEEEGQVKEFEAKKQCIKQLEDNKEMMSEVVVASLKWPQPDQ